jgi:hypothetical protein
MRCGPEHFPEALPLRRLGADGGRALLSGEDRLASSSDRVKSRSNERPHADLPTRANPEQTAIANDRNSVVQKLIDALPEDLRQPLALAATDELTSRQIAPLVIPALKIDELKTEELPQ